MQFILHSFSTLECFGRFAGELIFILSDIFSKMGTYLHIHVLVVVSFICVCLDKENLKLIAFVSLDLAGQTFSQFVLIITYENSFLVSCSH